MDVEKIFLNIDDQSFGEFFRIKTDHSYVLFLKRLCRFA